MTRQADPCPTCNGTGRIDRGGYTEDCQCLEDGYCPACSADNVNVPYTTAEGLLWPWDGTTPCPLCGWSLDQ